jgi:cobalt-zinc-cadmium efflux system outer membrane protein
MAQMESRRMENMVFEKVQSRRETEIELNTLLDMPLEKTWPATEPPPALVNISLTLDEVQALAEENSPHYREAQHELNHSRAMLSRSRLEYAPDIGVMYEYQTAGEGTRGTGPAGQQLSLSLSVPLWLKRPMALTAGANAHILESESVARAMTNMVRKMVAMEYTEIQTHTTLAKKIEDEILPAAQAALNTTREQYSAGRGDFLRLLEANRSWIGARVEYEEQLYHTLEHWSELERWVGAALPRAPQEK